MTERTLGCLQGRPNSEKLGGSKPFKAVRIDNSSSLETQAWEQESNPNPRFPWAAGPVDQRTTHLCFSGIEPPQAEAKN
ncbi:hypothetical protein DSO57_1012757, partial [Entomophthora muscae]